MVAIKKPATRRRGPTKQRMMNLIGVIEGLIVATAEISRDAEELIDVAELLIRARAKAQQYERTLP